MAHFYFPKDVNSSTEILVGSLTKLLRRPNLWYKCFILSMHPPICIIVNGNSTKTPTEHYKDEEDNFLEDFLHARPKGFNGIKLDLNEFDMNGWFLTPRNL